jgi:3'-phosphoadenosine 5'-phosphosulfate sulfotransferase (PAPS reductase)/FAD synthetase
VGAAEDARGGGALVEGWQLDQRVSLPLEAKDIHTDKVIREYYERNDGVVYVSFSGGKDSSVLAYKVLRLYPDVPLVFCDTGLEFPEIKHFVNVIFPGWIEKTLGFRPTIITIRPEMGFREVIDKYGYPVISKEQAGYIYEIRRTKSEYMRNKRLHGIPGTRNPSRKFGKISDKWHYLIDAPFEISDKCCDYMKKKPFKKFEKETGRHPMIGVMAAESQFRRRLYINGGGCNVFTEKRTVSWPLAIWTEQNILRKIVGVSMPIATVYGTIYETDLFTGHLATTGEPRTGCMWCMFGAHLDGRNNRFMRMKKTHPKIYDYCINQLGLGRVLDYIRVPYR